MNYWHTIDTTSPTHVQVNNGTCTESVNINTSTCASDLGIGPGALSRNDQQHRSPFIETRSTRRNRNRDEQMTAFLLQEDRNMCLPPSEAPNSNLHHTQLQLLQIQLQRQMQTQRNMSEETNAQYLISLTTNTNKSRRALGRSYVRSRKRASRNTPSHNRNLKRSSTQEYHGHVQDFESRPTKRTTLDPDGNADHNAFLCNALKSDEKTYEIDPSFFLQLGLDDIVQQDCEFDGHDYAHASSYYYPFEDSSFDPECSNEQEAGGSTYAAAVPASSLQPASVSPSNEQPQHEYAYHDEELFENHEQITRIEPTWFLGSSSLKGFMQNVPASISSLVVEHNSFDTTITEDDYRNRPLLPMHSEPRPLSSNDKEVLLRVLNAV